MQCLAIISVYIGEPAHVMHKFDVDRAPCLLLGHQKVDLPALEAKLEAASDQAKRAETRQKKMDETCQSQSISDKSSNDSSNHQI